MLQEWQRNVEESLQFFSFLSSIFKEKK
uniref:Uncharacterized protein n=1 Tax=Rhizophora mucronata TaxID=61149 RepID=A0A2P2PXR1_RHIMU